MEKSELLEELDRALAVFRSVRRKLARDGHVGGFNRVETDESIADKARAIYAMRRGRQSLFPQDLFAEPAWDLLLDLFIKRVEGRQVSVTSACLAAGVPTTTGLRWIANLESAGLLDREPCTRDQRVCFVTITALGSQRMRLALSNLRI